MAMHSRPHAPPSRWSKKTDALVRHVASRCRPSLQSELGRWLEESPRFSDFLTKHQDKVRKKLTVSDDEETRLDVRAELLVAYLLLADRRFELAFEAYGARQRGPDLSVTYRANQRFNLEVTRLRADASEARLASVIAGKLRQLPAGMANALLIAATGFASAEDTLAAAARLLRQHADARDDEFFTRRGFSSAREFHAQWLRLSALYVLDETTDPRTLASWPNREATHQLPREAQPALTACLTT
jgi:hypothetical protein